MVEVEVRGVCARALRECCWSWVRRSEWWVVQGCSVKWGLSSRCPCSCSCFCCSYCWCCVRRCFRSCFCSGCLGRCEMPFWMLVQLVLLEQGALQVSWWSVSGR